MNTLKIWAISWFAVLSAWVFMPADVRAFSERQDHPVEQEEMDFNAVEFTQLAPAVWMHTSYLKLPEWGKVPTNGLIVILDDKDVLLVDTAWNNKQTTEILTWVKAKFKRDVKHAIFTHAHSDKMGGVQSLIDQGVKTYAHPLSNDIAPSKGLTRAAFDLQFDNSDTVHFSNAVDVFYPGPAHTKDNIVVVVKSEQLLFGGCMIRPENSRSLGNIADGNIEHWDRAVENIQARFPEILTVVPSHGPPSNHSLFELTVDLVKEAQLKQ